MDYRHTNFAFLREDCVREFGAQSGTAIYNQACVRFRSLLENVADRNHAGIKKHIVKNMVPIIAYYLTLQNYGYSKEAAYGLALKITQKAAYKLKRKNAVLANLPFAYRLFKLFSKGVVKSMYPAEGWDIDWITFDAEEIHMNFKSCIYFDITIQFGCPELCTVFCKNDTVAFSGYAPKIRFVRNGTIAAGAVHCDFHFIRGK